jgi:hypothetical protein
VVSGLVVSGWMGGWCGGGVVCGAVVASWRWWRLVRLLNSAPHPLSLSRVLAIQKFLHQVAEALHVMVLHAILGKLCVRQL